MESFPIFLLVLAKGLSSKLNFDLCQRAEIIQVGLNMHSYKDIRNASSFLRGSTSSFTSSSMIIV